MPGAETRLATYGTLAPGRANAHHLGDLRGTWTTGQVRGRLVQAGWGADLGFPGIILDEGADPVDVHLFHSDDLPEHWPRLDAFEGPGYRRTEVQVTTANGAVSAYIYQIHTE